MGRTLARPPAKILLVALLIISAVWAAVYVPGMANPPLFDDADSVHAEAAREIVTTGDWVTLHADGVRYLDYAPLMFWSTAISYKIFGFNEFATRLPLGLYVLALLWVTYLCGRDWFGDQGGLYAALALGTSIGPYLFTRFMLPDVMIGLWLTIVAWLFLRGINAERPTRAQCWGIAAACAAGVMTKGLMGVVFPLGIIFGYLMITGDLRRILRFRLVSSTLVFFALALPWHVLATLRNPDMGGGAKGFFWFYFINEQINRYLDKRIPRDYDKVRLWIFWTLLLVWLFPWCVYLYQAARKITLKRMSKVRSALSAQPQLYFAVWALFILLFFSFSTRQEYYTLPAVPPLALLVGAWLAEEQESPPASRLRRAGVISTAVLFALGAIVGLATITLAIITRKPAPGTDLYTLLKSEPAMYALSMGHFFDLTTSALGMFKPELLLFGSALLLGTTAALLFRLRGKVRASNYSIVVMMPVAFFAVHLALAIFMPVLGSKAIAEKIEQQYKPGDVIVIDDEYTGASTVNFYTGIPVHLVNGKRNALWFGSMYPDCPKVFETDDSLLDKWRSPQRVFLVAFKDSRIEQLRGIAPVHELMSSGGKILVTNH